MIKENWIKPTLKEHGDLKEITQGIEEFGNAKEVGGDDGGTWLGQTVSG